MGGVDPQGLALPSSLGLLGQISMKILTFKAGTFHSLKKKQFNPTIHIFGELNLIKDSFAVNPHVWKGPH